MQTEQKQHTEKSFSDLSREVISFYESLERKGLISTQDRQNLAHFIEHCDGCIRTLRQQNEDQARRLAILPAVGAALRTISGTVSDAATALDTIGGKS
jgi:hypothetical protein